MTAIYKRELKSYFQSMTGYVLIAFLVIFTGIYFMAYNLNSGYPYFSYVLMNINYVLIIIIPMLTMRSFAEERKNKTDQLLLAAPVKLFDIVMGKYLAMVTVFAVPCLIFCIFPIIIKSFGTAYLKVDYLSILMFFLLGCVYLAIGMFLSSLTESQIIAAVTTFGVLLLIYLGRTDQFPPDISYKRHDRYCGIRYHCGADHLPDDGKLDDRRNYRSNRSCCGCDRKLCKIFII